MSQTIIPPGYRPALGLYDTQSAISLIKDSFSANLRQSLNLKRVSAPLFVRADSGLNDDLSGYERPVSFDIAETGGLAQVVHSLAKWKRVALHRYGFAPGEGLYTDMNAIRRDEVMDNLHSIYVDQWDWERVIIPEQRTLEYLRETAVVIVAAICDTLEVLKRPYPAIGTELCREVACITTQELEDLYPALSPEKREEEFTRLHKTALIMQIGGTLRSGGKHGSRAPDYDDWRLNGDILFWSDTLGCPMELSSMGVRVDAAALDAQLTAAGCDCRRTLPYHEALLSGQLPLTIGGGIGQSRMCLLLMGKAHIGEVHSSIWDTETLRICEENGVILL